VRDQIQVEYCIALYHRVAHPRIASGQLGHLHFESALRPILNRQAHSHRTVFSLSAAEPFQPGAPAPLQLERQDFYSCAWIEVCDSCRLAHLTFDLRPDTSLVFMSHGRLLVAPLAKDRLALLAITGNSRPSRTSHCYVPPEALHHELDKLLQPDFA
jgi:hypothetical protein